MKSRVELSLESAIKQLKQQQVIESSLDVPIFVERTRDASHGDFATNLALTLAKKLGRKPRDLAAMIVAALPGDDAIVRTEIAGPGFINFTLRDDAWHSVIDTIRNEGSKFGRSTVGEGKRVMVEFVSANPTGPLHVGHGRGAAYGDTLSRILAAAGYDTFSEYYVNDAGRQMDILALSVWLRYLEARLGARPDAEPALPAFPANAYKGDYVHDIARNLSVAHGETLVEPIADLFNDLPEDPDAAIDLLVSRCKKLLGEARFLTLFDFGCDALVDEIRKDLGEFGVEFDRWFSERSLVTDGSMQAAVDVLDANGHIYEKDGARWFRATAFGDEKDRVVTRANGSHTYFSTDLAYHYNKAERGFDQMIDVFGADHHGYVKRIKASFEALGHAPSKLDILLVQFAVLYRGGNKVSMSTRGGDFVTLRELREEVGNDAARFFYAMRRADQHMDFDLDLAKSQSSENPVYYVQYAHARICSVFRQSKDKGLTTPEQSPPNYSLLQEEREISLMQNLARYPEVVIAAADGYEPHLVAYYLRELATAFHGYYNAHPFLESEAELRLARLGLIDATRQVIANGLDLLGVSAPTQM